MDSAAGITTFKYNWTGKKAKVTKIGPGYASSQSVKVNSKKQVISKERTQKGSDEKTVNSYKYFGDGKLKQVVSELKGSDYSSKITRTYNKGGYPVSQESDDLTVTWKYTMDKKKNCPKQVIVSARQSGKTEKFKVIYDV